MNKQARSRKFTAKQSARLGAYLAAGLGASTVATSSSDAAIVNINIGSGPGGFDIDGMNAGLADNDFLTRSDFPISEGGVLWAFNAYYGAYGLRSTYNLLFATGSSSATPVKFSRNNSIGSGAYWTAGNTSLFRYYTSVSSDFGSGSYMGFKTATGNYGWLEVTWDSKTSDFQILSGAYEDQVGVAILAGQGAAPIPEPGTWVAMAVFAGGAAFAGWRKRRDEAQQEAA